MANKNNFYFVYGHLWVVMAKTLANTDFYQKTFGHAEPQSVMKK
jgi:hypothetical protein